MDLGHRRVYFNNKAGADYRRVRKLLFLRGQRIAFASEQGRLLKRLCRKLKMKTPPVFIASRSAPTPMAIGFFKPVIVIAPSLLEHENLDLILMHELIHIRQKDLWKKVLLSAAQAVHWFNPLVWLMNNQAENDIEMACDQRLLKDSPKEVRAVYGRMLIDVIRQTRLPMTALSTRFSTGKPLKKRIQALFDLSRKRKGNDHPDADSVVYRHGIDVSRVRRPDDRSAGRTTFTDQPQ